MKTLLFLFPLLSFAQIVLPLAEPADAAYTVDALTVEWVSQPNIGLPNAPYRVIAGWKKHATHRGPGLVVHEFVNYSAEMTLSQAEVAAARKVPPTDEVRAVLAARGIPEGSEEAALVSLGVVRGTEAMKLIAKPAAYGIDPIDKEPR